MKEFGGILGMFVEGRTVDSRLHGNLMSGESLDGFCGSELKNGLVQRRVTSMPPNIVKSITKGVVGIHLLIVR